jgi:hypothetical protein
MGNEITTLENGWRVINTGQPPEGWTPVNPHVCPGCGRCKDCGRPYETQPFTPWPGYPNPYIGDPVWPYGGPFYTSTTTVTSDLNGGQYQVWN